MSELKTLVLASPWATRNKAEFDQGVTFEPPATEESLRRLEEALGVTVPAELRAALAEANGIHSEGYYLVLEVEQILQCNRDFRNEDWGYRRGDEGDPDREQPVDAFLVISELLGNGDFYAVCLAPIESFRPGDVIHWDHETNGRSLVAHDLRGYITGGNPGIR